MMWIVGLMILALLAFALWGSGRTKPAGRRQRAELGTTMSAQQIALLEAQNNRNQPNSSGDWAGPL